MISDLDAMIVPDTDTLLERAGRALQLRRPEAVYRLQLNRLCPLRDAVELVPYLHDLGITDLYSSPALRARPGSLHGYDIVDHQTLNPEIGTDAEYDRLLALLARHGMGEVLDIVPNHMSIHTPENAWWMDVLENGLSSRYAEFFDIDWQPLKPDLTGKVLLPVLSDQFGRVLESGKLELRFQDGSFTIVYGDRVFPIAPRTSMLLLSHGSERLAATLGAHHPAYLELLSILTAIEHLPSRHEIAAERREERLREKEIIKRRLAELCQASPEVLALVRENVAHWNGVVGNPRSFDAFDQLLMQQPYRLCYWRVAADEINYRRFFDQNELAALMVENERVFEATHQKVWHHLDRAPGGGLRVDHCDGLFDPTEYLWRLQRTRFIALCEAAAGEPGTLDEAERARLREALGRRHEQLVAQDATAPLAQPLYVVVEKILGPGESLPSHWPVCGTTGYDFLNSINGLLVDRASERALSRTYARFIGTKIDYRELVHHCKRLIMQVTMSGEVATLGHRLDRISEMDRAWRDFTLNSLTAALVEIIACFPVYRTYFDRHGGHEHDRRFVEAAVAEAKSRNPAIDPSVYDFVRAVLLGDGDDEVAGELRHKFVGRFQQLTSPIMARGVEDTAFYLYNRLISLNEVGGSPDLFGSDVDAFHRENVLRQQRWPFSLLATSTHDTKRSEDVRARLNVLSEVPVPWSTHVFRWARLNRSKKHVVDGEPAPARNDEYLLYQTLLGVWPTAPLAPDDRSQLIERLQGAMLKAVREAKQKTSWISPSRPYEAALEQFLVAILEPRSSFLRDFAPFAEQVARAGVWNSLVQTLLKLTSPGVPDIYQGCELLDFSLVDPDNRRPVDFRQRRRMLAELRARMRAGEPGLARALLEQPFTGAAKLYTIAVALDQRRAHPQLFTRGDYLPLTVGGERREHVCAFARRHEGTVFVTVVPRLLVKLTGEIGRLPTPDVWADTHVVLPGELRGTRHRDCLSGRTVPIEPAGKDGVLSIGALLGEFPVALLECSREQAAT